MTITRRLERLAGRAGGIFARVDAAFTEPGAEGPGPNKWSNLMNTKTNRRTVITKSPAAALAAGAITAPPMVAEAAEPNDQELIELGKIYAEQFSAMRPVFELSVELSEKWHGEMEKVGCHFSQPGYDPEKARRIADEVGFKSANEESEVAFMALDQVSKRAFSIQPLTTEGLAALALIVRNEVLGHYKEELPYRDLDYHEEVVARLCDAIAKMAAA